MSRSSAPWDDSDPDPASDDVGGLPRLEESEVMASIDATDSHPEFVIADVSRDEAWLSVAETEAPVLREWC
ncbi:MAG: hypothetical protein A07HR60_01071 [uncultured archaeon A07HR60]|jgi:hypothetical protein|nr:MAG: hypothetical protein J07HR59_00450 [Halorubrum sp. J07HR59]ESS12131.1 MAG: hypothetical protein A07HR60_01071 [uncultured archaeon A07HR60]